MVELLKSRFRGVSNITIVDQAISNSVGTTNFQIMSKSVINSILPYEVKDDNYYGIVQEKNDRSSYNNHFRLL